MNFIFSDPSLYLLFCFIFFDASIRIGRYLKKKIWTPKFFIEEEPYVLCDIGRLYIGNIFRIHFKIFFFKICDKNFFAPQICVLVEVRPLQIFLSVLRFDRNILPSTASLETSLWTHPNLNHLRGIAFPPTSKSRIEIIIQCDPNKQE